MCLSKWSNSTKIYPSFYEGKVTLFLTFLILGRSHQLGNGWSKWNKSENKVLVNINFSSWANFGSFEPFWETRPAHDRENNNFFSQTVRWNISTKAFPEFIHRAGSFHRAQPSIFSLTGSGAPWGPSRGIWNVTLSLSQLQDRDTKFILRTRAKSPFARYQFPGDYRLLLLVGYILVFSGQHSVVPILWLWKLVPVFSLLQPWRAAGVFTG